MVPVDIIFMHTVFYLCSVNLKCSFSGYSLHILFKYFFYISLVLLNVYVKKIMTSKIYIYILITSQQQKWYKAMYFPFIIKLVSVYTACFRVNNCPIVLIFTESYYLTKTIDWTIMCVIFQNWWEFLLSINRIFTPKFFFLILNFIGIKFWIPLYIYEYLNSHLRN